MNKYNIDFFLHVLVQDKNTSLKLPVGVSPLQLVNLHRNRRYFVIKLHTYFLKTNKNCIAFINILWVSTVFLPPYLFLDTAPHYSDPWPRLARFTSYFLIMLFFFRCPSWTSRLIRWHYKPIAAIRLLCPSWLSANYNRCPWWTRGYGVIHPSCSVINIYIKH